MQYVFGAQRNQFHRDYLVASSSYGKLALLVKWKQRVDEIMIMENRSTEPMPGHYVPSTFLANTRKSLQCLHLRQGTCKRKTAACRERDR